MLFRPNAFRHNPSEHSPLSGVLFGCRWGQRVMTTGRTLAITGLVAGVAVLALGISHTGFTIRQPEYALSARHCLSYERKGHVQAFCAMTRRYCEQRVRQFSPQEKLITPCRPDFETVICWPDRSGTLVPLGQSLTPRVPFEDITYPCKRTIPTGQRPGNVLPSPA